MAMLIMTLQSSPLDAGTSAAAWLGSSAPAGIISSANNTASNYAACVAQANGTTTSCTEEASNPLAPIMDYWSAGWNVVATIGSFVAFASQAAIPWATILLAANYMLTGSEFILQCVALSVVLVLSVLNIVQWITLAKVVTTRQLN